MRNEYISSKRITDAAETVGKGETGPNGISALVLTDSKGNTTVMQTFAVLTDDDGETILRENCPNG